MTYLASAIGVRKALTLKLQGILQDKVNDLNIALSANSDLSFLNSSPFGSIATTHVVRGDIESLWDATNGSIRIGVASGGFESGQTNGVTQEYIDNTQAGGKKYILHSTVFVLFHTNAFRILDTPTLPVASQSQVREDALSTVEDWLNFDVLNHKDNRALTLSSQVFHTQAGSDYDYVGMCNGETFSKGIFYRGNNQSLACWGISAIHTCLIA